jgi:uncharacterized membrane protein YkoI
MKYKIVAKLIFSFLLLAGIFLLTSTNVSAQKKDDDDKPVSPKLAKKAKITMEAAREIALKRIPGTVLEGELEKGKGKLVYSFDIRTADNKIMEVNVDAKTGEIVLVEEDNEDDDDGEDNGDTR